MPLSYVISTTLTKWFVFPYNFHKTEETLLRVSILEKIKAQRVRHSTETGKNTNGAASAPVDGKGFM
jgi:hypothetical protein